MLKQVTYDNLDLYIEFEPSAKVKATGDHVVMMCHDDSGVVCEDDYGAVTYEHNELEYEEWHLPYITTEEIEDCRLGHVGDGELLIMSAARCAR